MPLPLLLLGVLGAGAAILFKEDEETTVSDSTETVTPDEAETLSKLPEETASAPNVTEVETAAKTVPSPNEQETVSSAPTLKRGDRFTCADTGEVLQVRALGGRPYHHNA